MVSLLVDDRNYKDGSVDTVALAAGALEASAAGRAKMDDDYFDLPATIQAKFSTDAFTLAAVNDVFATASIALDRLAETVIQADGGAAFTADQSHGGFKITSLAAGVASTDAVNVQQLNDAIVGLDKKESARVATTADLPASTPAGSGVGKTITADANGVLTIDGVATVLGDRVLVKNYGGTASSVHNGIYDVTTEGTAGVPFVLTRSTDADGSPSSEVTANMYLFIEEGTTNDNKGFTLVTNDPIVVDTTALQFTQFTVSGSQDLAGVLATGNTTGGNDVSLSSGDKLTSVAEMTLEATTTLDTSSNGNMTKAPNQHPTLGTTGYSNSINGGEGALGAGNSSDGGTGGPVNVTGGNGGSYPATAGIVSSGAGGPATVAGGNGGEAITTQAGVNPAGDGGVAVLTGGQGGEDNGNNTPPGDGGDATVKGGDAGASSGKDGDGGDAIMRGGAKRNSGVDGSVLIGTSDTNNTTIGNTTDHKEVALKADNSATGLITFQSQGAGSAVPMQEAGDTEGLVLNGAFAGDSIIAAINENRSNIAAVGGTEVKNEAVTPQNLTTDTLLTDTLNFTPLVDGDVQLKLNGLEAINGVNFTVSGTGITWLGTVHELRDDDTLRAFYKRA